MPLDMVKWMDAFLMKRSRRVKVDDRYSTPFQPKGGIPQGTVTGPVKFLLQINNFATPCPIVKYVDDGTIMKCVLLPARVTSRSQYI